MAREIPVSQGRVEIFVERADDGVGVFRDGTEILHVHYRKSDMVTFDLRSGQNTDIVFEIYNLTGGGWEASLVVNAGGRRVYEARPRGWTIAGWNVAWRETFTLRPS